MLSIFVGDWDMESTPASTRTRFAAVVDMIQLTGGTTRGHVNLTYKNLSNPDDAIDWSHSRGDASADLFISVECRGF